jgi:hypothetical protein
VPRIACAQNSGGMQVTHRKPIFSETLMYLHPNRRLVPASNSKPFPQHPLPLQPASGPDMSAAFNLTFHPQHNRMEKPLHLRPVKVTGMKLRERRLVPADQRSIFAPSTLHAKLQEAGCGSPEKKIGKQTLAHPENQNSTASTSHEIDEQEARIQQILAETKSRRTTRAAGIDADIRKLFFVKPTRKLPLALHHGTAVLKQENDPASAAPEQRALPLKQRRIKIHKVMPEAFSRTKHAGLLNLIKEQRSK